MKLSCFLSLTLLAGSTLSAQQPAATPARAGAAPAASLLAQFGPRDPDLLAAKPGEPVLLPKLVGVRLVASPDQLKDPGFPAPGVDTSHLPWIDQLTFAPLPPLFLNKPASRESLHRIELALEAYASVRGHSFVTVYVPPQDITGGFVQFVVSEARADTKIEVHGAHYFSPASYRAAIRQQPGQPVNKSALEEDVAWLNRNPYRHVQVAATSGATPGSTALDLDVQERIPWGLSASYDNTGTKNTDVNRVSAGVTWADAFGRGDEMNYRFIADPHLEHSKTHSLTYTSFLPWRDIATLSGSYTSLDTIMPEPLTQTGTSWQVGARYEIPLRDLRPGLSQSLSFSADFKYSDNNLEFAQEPITNNPTDIAEVGAMYGVGFRGLGGQNSVTVTGYFSPGGIGKYGTDAAYNGSRPGAKAQFAYATVSLSHEHPLVRGFVWELTVNAQVASGALLGSEQFNGAGAYAVRGYEENSAFGDDGAMMSNELHAPGFSLWRARDHVDLFAFVDAASLYLHVDRQSTDLRSVGLGVNYQFGQYVSARAAYGWHDRNRNSPRTASSGHGHVSVSVEW